MIRTMTRVCALAATVAAAPSTAQAFCGFYISGAGGDMFNNATQVVLMRDGTRTVLSMQNNYEGPPTDFAMVVPVPVVLQKENVKTLPKEIFDRVDRLAAPRLVEYWEQDPCAPAMKHPDTRMRKTSAAPRGASSGASAGDLGVTIEAQFEVGEYDVVILGAKDSAGLETWLRQEKYNIPEGAKTYLEPYVQKGTKFFVARVDVEKVTFEDGMATLSPLRFYYDTDEFALPVRLGLMNAKGAQDLIVHVLARGKRYQVANYDNVTIPTNLDVTNDTRDRFGEFYAALFDRTLEKNPGAVVTEYAWDAGSCDPCPTPALSPSELATLGMDVLAPAAAPSSPQRKGRRPPPRPRPNWRGFVLTRLHVRYTPESLKDDLVFSEAPAIVGGREMRGADGKLEERATEGGMNNFQGRYAIRHEWTGAIECNDPIRGRWGGPPSGHKGKSGPEPAVDLAFAPRGKVTLASFVKDEIPELELEPAGKPAAGTLAQAAAPETPEPATKKKKKKGCSSAGASSGGAAALLVLLALAGLRRRRSPIRYNRVRTR